MVKLGKNCANQGNNCKKRENRILSTQKHLLVLTENKLYHIYNIHTLA